MAVEHALQVHGQRRADVALELLTGIPDCYTSREVTYRTG